MESMGAFPEGEWDFYNRIFSMEEPDFPAELLGQCSFPPDSISEGTQASYPSTIYQKHPETNYDTMVELEAATDGSLLHFGNNAVATTPNLNHSFSDNNLTNYTNRLLINPSSCNESYFLSDHQFNCASSDLSMSMDFSIMDEKATSTLFSQLLADIPIMGDTTTYTIDHPPGNEISCDANQLKRKLHDPEPEPEPKTNQPNQAKKRPRAASDVEKKKRNVRSKKSSKVTTTSTSTTHEDHQEAANGGVLMEGKSLSNYSSEDENGSQDSNGGASSESKASHEALIPSGKARASRGSATDPQSLYARKRRERINERLRILQNLVPNGTKVDISTMLEEAVQYVKFLQLQIKLLSSDDLWMFAPLAYNGIDIGFNHKISMLL